MKVINFYGGAAIGKSTIAADMYSKLKRMGYRTELVGEFAKWLWYQNATDIVEDQLYLFAEQAHRTRTLEKYSVDFAICDSPLPLNIIYNREPSDAFNTLVMQEFNRYDNLNYLLRRNDEFLAVDGRPAPGQRKRPADPRRPREIQRAIHRHIPVGDRQSPAGLET